MVDNDEENGLSREEVIQKLLVTYQNKYGNSGDFFIHPSIEYYSSSDAGGVGVRATEAIPQGTVILTVPDVERVSLSNITATATDPTLCLVKSNQIHHVVRELCRFCSTAALVMYSPRLY